MARAAAAGDAGDVISSDVTPVSVQVPLRDETVHRNQYVDPALDLLTAYFRP